MTSLCIGICRNHSPLTLQRYEAPRFGSWTCPPAGHVNPLGEAAAILALDVDNVGVAAAAAAHPVLLGGIPDVPELVLLQPLAVVQRGLLQVRVARELAGGRVGGAVLDRRVAVAEVAEVVDVAGGEESTGGEGVYGRVTPLDGDSVLAMAPTREMTKNGEEGQRARTRSIQNPPLRSIIWKKSSYSLLRKKERRAISKLDQKWHMLYFSPSMASASISGRLFRPGSLRRISSGRGGLYSGSSSASSSASLSGCGSTNISHSPLDGRLFRRL